jgi:hypothetical protein
MRTLEQLYSIFSGWITEKGEDGFAGYYETQGKKYRFIFSYGGGWEHASISVVDQKRVPTWDEMCMFKDLFWLPEETVVQYHPAKSEYVNCHPYVLHLWRWMDGEFPKPPKNYVG